MKQINLKIITCEECPYRIWEHNAVEYKCKLCDKILFYDDYKSIPEWCELENIK